MQILTPGKGAFLALAVISFAVLAATPTEAWARAKDKRQTDIILPGLPARRTPEYEALVKMARPSRAEPLEMTGAEMWSVPTGKIESLRSAALARGARLLWPGAAATKVLAPMNADSQMTAGQKAMMDRTMGLKSVMGVEMMSLPEAPLMEYALTKGMAAAEPGATPPTLSIPLNGKTTLTARRTAVAKTKDGYVWRGEVEGTGDPVTLMWWPSGRLTGSITYRDRKYMVKDAGEGMHAMTEVAPAMLPPEHAPAGAEMLEKMKMRDDPLVKQGDASMLRPGVRERPDRADLRNLEDAGPVSQTLKRQGPVIGQSLAARKNDGTKSVTISVIVAYTKQAAGYYGDITKDLIALAVEDANQSFRNSGIGHIQIELAHAYETGYSESGSHFDHVWRFADKGDGQIEEVHGLRDQYRADVAILVVHDPRGCGLATRVAADAGEAFAVVHHECAATMYSLAHEIGHIVGARHDRALDQSSGPFPYGHGFVNGTKWRTMMAYKDTCNGCPRVPVWSNPRVKIRGARAGTRAAVNAKVLDEQAARVAAFR